MKARLLSASLALALATAGSVSIGAEAVSNNASATAKPAAAQLVAAEGDVVAFKTLQSLAGRWQGKFDPDAKTDSSVVYENASGGKAVIERLFAGEPHEMITVYYLARNQLRATHYCAAGNQPAFKYSRADSNPSRVQFAFDGGTGFDPAQDSHVHDGYLRVLSADQIEMHWSFHEQGKESGVLHSVLSRR